MNMQANVREVAIHDAEAVFEFFLSQGKVRGDERALWLERWHLLFQKNPWRAGGAHPLGWVIKEGGGAIKGYAGNIILPYTYGGAMYKACCTTGLAVDPAYRRLSIPMLKGYFIQTGIDPVRDMERTVLGGDTAIAESEEKNLSHHTKISNGVDIFMCSTANDVSGMIFDALKIPKFPVENYDAMYYFLMNPSNVAYAFLRRRMPRFLARTAALLIGALITPWLYLRGISAFRGSGPKIAHVFEKSLAELDETYDAFWELVKSQRKDQFMFLRTREALQWHFACAGNWARPSIFCYYEGNRMLGYAIIDKHFEKETGVLRFRCADILTFGDKEEIIKQLIGAACIRAKEEGADFLVCYFLPAPVRRVVESIAHMRRKRGGGVYMRTLNSKLSGIDIMRKWYATCADGDSAFWSLTVPRP